jgi:CheY-like chemotaxis protein
MSVLAAVPAKFLLVDDEPRMAQVVGRPLQKLGSLTTANSLQSGIQATRAQFWSGLIVDFRLGGSSGIDLLHQTPRLAVTETPLPDRQGGFGAACIMSAHPQRGIRQAARELGADFLPKDGPLRRLLQWFARRAIASEFLDAPASLLVADFAARFDLPPMQVRLVALEVACIKRERWPVLLGVKESTINSHARKVINAVRPSIDHNHRLSLAVACRPLIRSVLAGNTPRTRDWFEVLEGDNAQLLTAKR